MQVHRGRRPRITPGLLLAFVVLAPAACNPADGEISDRGAAASSPAAGVELTQAPSDSIAWKAVDRALGRKGEVQPGGIYKFSMPRSDLAVTSAGVRIKPALALGSWLAFKPKGAGVVAMGDLVLTEREYVRVLARLRQGNVGQTALHKHLPEQSPPLWWMHIHAEGDPLPIAATVKAALALTGTPAESAPRASSGTSTDATSLDTAAIDDALGRGGDMSGGVYHISVPRAETIRAGAIEVPPSMGTATALNFQPTGGGKAAINGDFVLLADEVQPVIAALNASGIQVVALHNHMLEEEPRLFFMHFWANDDAVKLARGLKAALDKTNSAQP
ncbi:MAG: DUF1259 domain-containing protein [Gemmatimonadales bacterium]|nr:DUF1259 domain-containing protein [Gemmatimonadales bacterium]